jgi:hypothetical protein
MQVSQILKQEVQERPLRVWVCVLLALLILYNPFMALTGSAHSFSVHGLARHRSTVGASELQHMGPLQDQNQQDVVNLQDSQEEFTGLVAEYEAVGFARDVEVAQPESVSRIWSRPPPLV